jgi:hypothetical protein
MKLVFDPLTGPDELAVRRTVTHGLMEAAWIESWRNAERAAVDLLDRLAADGYQLVKVTAR